jgi:hypothetical protein
MLRAATLDLVSVTRAASVEVNSAAADGMETLEAHGEIGIAVEPA